LGLLLRWHSMNFSPERQPSNEPKAEDNYKSRTMNVTPGTTDEQRTKADFIPSASDSSKPNVIGIFVPRQAFQT
jgi:hypothetical protein